MNQEQEWQDELDFFENSRKIIKSNISIYEQEYEQRHQESVELFKAMRGGDEELYNQLMTTMSIEDHSKSQLRKNRAAYQKPYFGRVDFTDRELDRQERIYIGKNGVLQNKTEVVIADWRAPVSSVYYENELGEGSYPLLEVKGREQAVVAIDLHLKRTYDIADGNLNGYYDSDVASNDELLVKYLSHNKDAVLGEIIATIQMEQNEIIRESPFANQLVQGVAGSGKTTVAMHRMSYILYNYKERFLANEFCVVGSNDLLLNYITSGLPELDVTNVKKLRTDELFTHLLKKEWKARYRLAEPFGDAGTRCQAGFYQELELFLAAKKRAYVNTDKLTDPELGILLTESINRALLEEHSEYSAARLLLQMDERVTSRLKSLAGRLEKEELDVKRRQYSKYYRKQFPKVTVTGLYQEFLESRRYESSSPPSARSSAPLSAADEHMTAMNKGQFDIYDVAALVLIYYRIMQKGPDEEFGQIFIDEAQDFGSGIYFVLKQVLPACYFTIMGDVSQNINFETGMNDWEDMRRWFLTGKKDRFRLLSKSYRNTIEISEYAGKILARASAGRYQITPVIRHGISVAEEQFWSIDELAERAGALITTIWEREYRSIAVICRDDGEVTRICRLLREQTVTKSPEAAILSAEESQAEGFQQGVMVLPVRMTKGLEFDAVILWNPERIEKLDRPGEAKQLYVAVTRALHELYVLRY